MDAPLFHAYPNICMEYMHGRDAVYLNDETGIKLIYLFKVDVEYILEGSTAESLALFVLNYHSSYNDIQNIIIIMWTDRISLNIVYNY